MARFGQAGLATLRITTSNESKFVKCLKGFQLAKFKKVKLTMALTPGLAWNRLTKNGMAQWRSLPKVVLVARNARPFMTQQVKPLHKND